MCGRFSLITDSPTLQQQYGVVNPDAYAAPRFNIAPSQPVDAVIAVDGERHLERLEWGLLPAWSKSRRPGYATINARAETVAEKPAFRDAFRHRRCIIPADGFYEWQGEEGHRQAWRIEPEARDRLLSFAGLWEVWEGDGEAVHSCTIIVTAANTLIAPIHPRMPLLLDDATLERWLDPHSDLDAVRRLLTAPAVIPLRRYPVSSYINNPQHDDPACLRPL